MQIDRLRAELLRKFSDAQRLERGPRPVATTLLTMPAPRTFCLAALLCGGPLLPVRAAEPLPEATTFVIKTLYAQMRYDVSELTIAPGAQVKIIFENPDDMPHNMVFFEPGTDIVAVSNKQMEKPEEALKRNWLPEDPRMWLHSKLLNPKETEEIVFKAPEKPGIYPFVCTFPGHAVTMQGRLKIFAPGPRLTGLKFALYLGDWKKLPDFAALTPHREGEVPDNLVQLKLDDYKNQFGAVFTGKLTAPKESDYTFSLAGDDGVRLIIDGKKVVEHDGIHPSAEIREGKTRLKAGEHDFRLEYFQAADNSEIYVAWRGDTFVNTPLSQWVHPNANASTVAKKKDPNSGMPLIVGKEPIVYRNFISGAGNHGIAVGYPGGVNVAWNAERMDLALIWRGAFIDAARHWTDRGAGQQPPLGYDVLRPVGESGPPFAVLASANAEWPKGEKHQRAAGFQWKGYSLDPGRFPTFSYEWNGLKVFDRFDIDATAAGQKLIRTIKIAGEIPADALFRAASGNSVQPDGAGYVIDAGKFGVEGRDFENKFKVTVEGATISGKNLIVPVRPEIKVTYSWLHNHAQHAHSH